MTNFFEFYQISIDFNIEEAGLKSIFYKNSKKYHPDFFTLESDEKQAEIMELSTYNNLAYKTLSDFDKRMQYILELKNALEEEGKNQIPQDFLMEMMDINEILMELEFDFDAAQYQKATELLEEQKKNIFSEVEKVLQTFDFESVTNDDLTKIKNYYFKRKYLLRIQNNLSKFASLF